MHPLRLRLMGPAYDHAAQPDFESLALSSF
jgi:hypothetical protein